MIFDSGTAISSRVRRLWFFITWAQEEIYKNLDVHIWGGESKDDTLFRWVRLYLSGDLDHKLVKQFNRFYDLSNSVPDMRSKIDRSTDRESP